MTLGTLAVELGWEALWEGWDDREVTGAYTSDLLSDVMARAEEGYLLVTVQAHKNTVAVAVLKDLAAVLVASGRPAPPDMVEAARNEGVPLFRTGLDQYGASWRIHQAAGV